MAALVIEPIGGLGNRLRVVFSYLKFAQASGRELVVYWPPSPACPGKFLSVFCPVPGVTFIPQQPARVDYRGCAHHPDVQLAREDYRHLVAHDAVRARVAELGAIPYAAVHVRRTDHVALAREQQVFTPDEMFYSFIDATRLPVYLACDDGRTQQAFAARYPAQIFVHAAIQPKARVLRQTSLFHAAVDLLACVEARQFMGTNYSSFSDLICTLRQPVVEKPAHIW